MPYLYDVAVRSEDLFDTDEPKIFRPFAHSSEQALRLVLQYLWSAQPNISMGSLQTTTDVSKKVGGYDDPMVEFAMKRQSGSGSR